eukprot:jgi/Bigna1/137080/aug1.37_g11788
MIMIFRIQIKATIYSLTTSYPLFLEGNPSEMVIPSMFVIIMEVYPILLGLPLLHCPETPVQRAYKSKTTCLLYVKGEHVSWLAEIMPGLHSEAIDAGIQQMETARKGTGNSRPEASYPVPNCGDLLAKFQESSSSLCFLIALYFSPSITPPYFLASIIYLTIASTGYHITKHVYPCKQFSYFELADGIAITNLCTYTITFSPSLSALSVIIALVSGYSLLGRCDAPGIPAKLRYLCPASENLGRVSFLSVISPFVCFPAFAVGLRDSWDPWCPCKCLSDGIDGVFGGGTLAKLPICGSSLIV